ncbi:ParA family protein [Desulforhopalus sp. IMCC35007]|uniref:ParA family protein n=1 Tax=Desulforhopalus sp. IMCC35007 TaxID=2569543 RepID=UPI0010ADD2AC|nr:ParA family protein [Desulforhopalus sp. IMCC35007]TKB06105.1 ParA family protein [Desulforhopalus sp. IMCC35007]
MSSIISISSHKGGVGKTVATLNLGVSLAKAGHKVLLIDGDPQGSLSMSVDMKKKSKAGLCQVISNKVRPEDVVVDAQKLPLSMVHLGIDSPLDLFRLTHGTKTKELKSLLKLIQAISQAYDFTLIDTANNVGSLNAVLLSCSNSVIIPITCKSNSVRSLPLLLKLLTRIKAKLNTKIALLGLMLPMLNVNNPYELEILTILREAFPRGTFFSTFVPFSPLFDKADVKAAPISFFAGAEDIQTAYDKLSFEVIQRLENQLKGLEDDEYLEKLF